MVSGVSRTRAIAPAPAPVGDDTDSRVRAVVRMLLAAGNQPKDSLAETLGISRTSVYSKLSGTSAFTVAEVAAMARHFGVEPGVFFAGPTGILPTVRITRRYPSPLTRPIPSVQLIGAAA